MPSTVRPGPPLESLEPRRVCSVDILGTPGPDVIRVARDEAGLIVTVNGVESRPAEPVDRISVDAGAGDDRVVIVDALAIGVAAIGVTGGAGVDVLTIDDAPAAAGRAGVTFDDPIDTYVSIVHGPGVEVRADASGDASAIEGIDYVGSAFADAIEVRGTNARATLALATADGDDTVTVGDDLDTRLRGAVSVDGGAGANGLVIDDRGDAFADTYFLAATADGARGTLRKNSGGATTTYGNVAFVTLHAGVAGRVPHNQQFRVASLPDTAVTIFAGSGDDALTVGDGVADLGGLRAGITFVGQDDVDRIDYRDTVGTAASAYAVSPFALAIPGRAAVQFFECEALNVVANAADNAMRVIATADVMNVTLNGGGGDDRFDVGGGDLDLNVANSVVVVGGAGEDALYLDDAADDAGADEYAIAAGQVLKSLRAVLWSTGALDRVERVDLTAGANDDVVRVSGATPGVRLSIDSGAGDDAIHLDRTGDGTGPPATVTIASGAGRDTLEVNGDFAGVDAVAAVAAGDALDRLTVRAGGRALLDASLDAVTRVGGALTVDGVIDLGGGTLVAAAADVARLAARAAAGHDGGTWTGGNAAAAIVSRVAANDAVNGTADGAGRTAVAVVEASAVGLPTFGDVTTAPGDAIVRLTRAGDANLDRTVGFADLVILAQHYGTERGATWAQGDFDFDADGAVGFADLVILAQNYGATVPTRPD